jgi:hypothetical protein
MSQTRGPNLSQHVSFKVSTAPRTIRTDTNDIELTICNALFSQPQHTLIGGKGCDLLLVIGPPLVGSLLGSGTNKASTFFRLELDCVRAVCLFTAIFLRVS